MHRHRDGPRQDAFGIRDLGDDAGGIAVVVCDGVGSLALSHIAAEQVVNSMLEAFTVTRDWSEAIREANSDLTEYIASHEAQGTMATTIIAAAVYPGPGDVWRVDAASIGDSDLWHLADTKWTKLLPPADQTHEADAEMYDGRTKALPTAALRSCQWTGEVTHGALFLMSDGVGLPLAMSTEVEQTLATWWANPPPVLDFAAQVGFARLSFTDDRTVVGVWPIARSSGAGIADGVIG